MKIEGFFRSIKSANETVEKLKEAGFNKSYTDLKDDNVQELNLRTNLAGTHEAPTLSSLVLDSGGFADEADVSPAAAASPMVSGMGGFEEISDVSCKLVVETDPENKERAESIIKEAGGHFKDPNLELHKMVKVRDELNDALDDVMK